MIDLTMVMAKIEVLEAGRARGTVDGFLGCGRDRGGRNRGGRWSRKQLEQGAQESTSTRRIEGATSGTSRGRRSRQEV